MNYCLLLRISWINFSLNNDIYRPNFCLQNLTDIINKQYLQHNCMLEFRKFAIFFLRNLKWKNLCFVHFSLKSIQKLINSWSHYTNRSDRRNSRNAGVQVYLVMFVSFAHQPKYCFKCNSASISCVGDCVLYNDPISFFKRF